VNDLAVGFLAFSHRKGFHGLLDGRSGFGRELGRWPRLGCGVFLLSDAREGFGRRGDPALGRGFVDQGEGWEIRRLDNGFFGRLLDLLGGGGSSAPFCGSATCSAFGGGSGRGF
jgi:hypothetical protein